MSALMGMLLLKRFENEKESKELRKELSELDFVNLVVLYIDKIFLSRYFVASKKQQKLIEEWRSLRSVLKPSDFLDTDLVKSFWLAQNPRKAVKYSNDSSAKAEKIISEELAKNALLDNRGNDTGFAIAIGRAGEKLFKKKFESSLNFRREIIGKTRIADETAALEWRNSKNESFLPFDFVLGDIYIEIKTSISEDSKGFYISSNEFLHLERNLSNEKYLLVKIQLGYGATKSLEDAEILRTFLYSGKEVAEMEKQALKYWVNERK